MTMHHLSTAQKWALFGHFLGIMGGACLTIAGLLELAENGRMPMYQAEFSNRPNLQSLFNIHDRV